MARSAIVVATLLSLCCGAAGKNVTRFAEKLFGSYTRLTGVPTKAILGPVAYRFLPGMSILRDPETDDVWFTLLLGQMWHTSGSETQYCFGPPKKKLAEQSPFSVYNITDTSVNFCWRKGLRGMPTQAEGCMGCDCARVLLSLTDPNTLRFQFWMSPPATHADVYFVRSGNAPTFKQAIESTMTNPYTQCQTVPHYGPNMPDEPILTTAPPSSGQLVKSSLLPLAGGCAEAVAENMNMLNDDLNFTTPNGEECHQLNGLNLKLDGIARFMAPKTVMNVSDVKVLFTAPAEGTCTPCDVSYTVSAKTADDEYIAVGFKGRSWERDFPYAPEHPKRPCYFGMCVDSFDNFTSDRIALGYSANGGCFREMVSKDFVGEPEDADYKILKGTSVERSGGRTILKFTVSQHWQLKNSSQGYDGPWRIMWAIGKVTPGNSACTANLGYHFYQRGTAPLNWLQNLGSLPCSSMDDALPSLV